MFKTEKSAQIDKWNARFLLCELQYPEDHMRQSLQGDFRGMTRTQYLKFVDQWKTDYETVSCAIRLHKELRSPIRRKEILRSLSEEKKNLYREDTLRKLQNTARFMLAVRTMGKMAAIETVRRLNREEGEVEIAVAA